MSSEALERLRGDLERGKPSRCAQWVLVSREDCLALLAEVARLEQELSLVDRNATVWHAEECGVHNANPPWRCTCDGSVLRASLAVAREREQRAVEALREAEFSQCGWAGGCPVCAETPDEWAPNRGHRRNCKLGAALVDEPAAATLAEPGGIGGSGATGATTAAGRRVATPGLKTDASSPGSASAAADEPGETP